ncbi:MAG: hypothetical protein ACI85I_002239 [Arenicella sp.]
MNLELNSPEATPRAIGTILASVMIVMWLFSLAFLTFPFGLGEGIIDGLQSVFGYSTGKTIGRVSATVLFIIIYPLVKYTIGSQKSYNTIIESYLKTPQENRGEIAGKGLSYLIISIIVFVVAIIIGGIAGTFL